MAETPVTPIETGTPFTLRDFIEAGSERLCLEVVVGGAGLDHIVDEPMTNRPGLALTGFYGYFAWRRLQVFGLAERDYLESLDDATRRERLQALFDRQAYCLIFACGMEIPSGVCEAAEAAGAVVLRSSLLTRDFFHRSAFILESLRAPHVKYYGTTIEVAGLGVMIEGAPGLGKSETALGLIKHGNALVADDLTCIRKDVANNILYASASPATRNYMEIRGIGIINVPNIFGVTSVRDEKQLDLIITLKHYHLKHFQDAGEGDLDRVGDVRYTKSILGVEIPRIVIPVSAGRDLVNLVETAAQQHKLRSNGHDAVRELDEHLCSRAAGNKSV